MEIYVVHAQKARAIGRLLPSARGTAQSGRDAAWRVGTRSEERRVGKECW